MERMKIYGMGQKAKRSASLPHGFSLKAMFYSRLDWIGKDV